MYNTCGQEVRDLFTLFYKCFVQKELSNWKLMECMNNSFCQKLSGSLSDEVKIGQDLIKYLIKLLCISHYPHRYAAVKLAYLNFLDTKLKT